MTELRQSYDDYPYPNLCFGQTHPDRLAVIGRILGMQPAPVTRCRVLELGSAMGGNIIPMAFHLPQSAFVGVDFSATQVRIGQEDIARLGLTNIELRHMDILDVTAAMGQFDYIIVHGIFSWVPAPVRQKILEICRDMLAPQGIAYISFNTYPGWHMLGAVRQMMLYDLRDEPDRGQWPARAHEFLAFLRTMVVDHLAPVAEKGHGSFLGTYSSMLAAFDKFVEQQRVNVNMGDALLLHDELEVVNQPFYFHEFMSQAHAHDLQYLAEAEFPKVMTTNLPEPVARGLMARAQDTLDLEQQMDFVRNRTFRQTLLCHKDVSISRQLRPTPALMGGLAFASRATSVPADPEQPNAVAFATSDGTKFTTDHAVTAAAMRYLCDVSPTVVPFADLLNLALSQSYDELPAAEVLDKDALTLSTTLLQAFSHSLEMIEIHAYVPEFVISSGDRPQASALARYLAGRGPRVVNARHERVNLDSIGFFLLPYLDGEHDTDALLTWLERELEAGNVRLADEDVASGAPVRQILMRELRDTLNWLGRAGVMVA